MTTWRCKECDEDHSGLATVFGPEAPDLWLDASDEERETGDINSDLCTLTVEGRTHYFLRGELELPVRDPALDVFTWSVWVSLSEKSWQTTLDTWSDDDRADLPPMFGWLSTTLPYEGPTTELATHVHTRAPGMCPLIELDPSVDHPLVKEQVNGITLHRVAEINAQLLG